MNARRPSLLVAASAALALSAACSKKPEPAFEAKAESPKAVEKQEAPAAQAPVEPAKPAVTREPTSPDPLGGKFSLEDATEGLPKKGTLRASIVTTEGTLDCKLFPDKAPITVANFVGLARGLRPFWDPKTAKWEKRPLYDGTTFHRTIAGFMIQGGDHLGDGTGGVGYEIKDELVEGLTHDRAGLLCMANRGPNTNGGQFFITDAATPHLTQMKSYTIFGECAPVDVIHKIANRPNASAHSDSPKDAVVMSKVSIERK